MRRRVLITGATGFVGGHLAERLSAEGWAVRALVRPRSDTAKLQRLGAELRTGSLGDGEAIESAARDVKRQSQIAADASALAGGNVLYPGVACTVANPAGLERAGGSLQMDPASSLGFRIDLEYPLARTATSETAEEGGALHRTPGGIRSGPVTALVVEPNESIRKLIVQQLAEQSVRAIPVTSAEEAKSICRRIQFDWVFCELSLPKGSGIELYEAVRHGIERFVFIADDAACAANSEAFQAADKAVLRKPVQEEAIEALIDELQGGAVLQGGSGELG